MEEQCINFEMAILAREVGFNIPTHNLYVIKDFENQADNGSWGSYKVGEFFKADINLETKNFKNTIAAPTQELLHKFIRNNYNLFVAVNFANKNQWYYDLKEVGKTSGKEYIFKSNYDYNNPEKALEAGLKHALEKIILER